MCQSLARSIEKDFPRLLALSQVQVTCSFCPRTLLEMEQMAKTRQQRALPAVAHMWPSLAGGKKRVLVSHSVMCLANLLSYLRLFAFPRPSVSCSREGAAPWRGDREALYACTLQQPT